MNKSLMTYLTVVAWIVVIACPLWIALTAFVAHFYNKDLTNRILGRRVYLKPSALWLKVLLTLAAAGFLVATYGGA